MMNDMPRLCRQRPPDPNLINKITVKHYHDHDSCTQTPLDEENDDKRERKWDILLMRM
jgi:hypothetical protein